MKIQLTYKHQQNTGSVVERNDMKVFAYILVKVDGYFDRKVIDDQGYFAPKPIFMVVKDGQNLEYDIYALAF